jgi:lipopolysaccharide export system permease protein
MMLRFEQLENRHNAGKSSLATISSDGLWLRQKLPQGHYILHAAAINPSKMALEQVIVFRMTDDDRFVSRIDAQSGILGDRKWHLKKASITEPNTPVRRENLVNILTDLTSENIQDSFAKPETMSFWALPGFIEVLEKAGFSGLRHRIYWYSLIADPFLLCAMVLFAAAFTLRPQRRGGTIAVLVSGVATGFVIYFASDVVYALGLSARLPPPPPTCRMESRCNWLPAGSRHSFSFRRRLIQRGQVLHSVGTVHSVGSVCFFRCAYGRSSRRGRQRYQIKYTRFPSLA